MTSYEWARAESADAPVAVLLPGVNYSVQAPVLYWCATLLAERGWHVQAVDWSVDDEALAHPLPFVERAAADAFDASPASSRRLVVTKSFGTYALPWARRAGIAGVWLTPLLTEEPVRRALSEATAADLAVGGELDAFWRPDTVRGTAAQLLSVPGAGHALTLPGDWRGSLDLQAGILAEIARHLDDG
ncbi:MULTISPECIES: hypothetical protein [unclassified Cryobacterium]|uniref:hypothetical protein n=1 Tax=unclassified Cryobacterium TaxID=2649013 RepID=UPI00106D7A89|nr:MULTISPECIES: hypothetical protein [unclassified Cryobacterium]TFC60879.1 hypothetical protein E3O60_06185 [Cryobacterium sp. TMB1-7]TFC92388.1 hypothetical protein E3T19_02840 [Cryobacterium sp. TMT4-31]